MGFSASTGFKGGLLGLKGAVWVASGNTTAGLHYLLGFAPNHTVLEREWP